MALTREQLLDAKGVKLQKVDLPEWIAGDGHVFIRPMPAATAQAFAELEEDDKGAAQEATMAGIAASVCDGQGALLFNDGDDLGVLPISAVTRITKAMLEFNGMADKGAKDLEGNSESDPGDDLPSS